MTRKRIPIGPGARPSRCCTHNEDGGLGGGPQVHENIVMRGAICRRWLPAFGKMQNASLGASVVAPDNNPVSTAAWVSFG